MTKAGSLTLPAKKLYEIVKSLPETDIRIAEDKGGVKVAADRFDSRMQTLPREDFPTLPEGGGAPTRDAAARGAQGDGGQDAVCDHRRGHAVFPERRAVRAAADSMSLVATDGHRLALVTVQARRQGRRTAKRSRRFCRRRRSANSAGC